MTRSLKGICALALLCVIIIAGWSCRHKDLLSKPQTSTPKSQFVHKTNPFSLRNVEKAMTAINTRSNGRTALSCGTCNPTYIYYRINPTLIDSVQSSWFANDTSTYMLPFPFGDGGVYNDTTLTEASIAQLADGNLYGIAPFSDTIIQKLSNTTNLQFTRLDTLVLLPDSSQELASESMRQAGFSPQIFGICLLKKPHGYVRVQDKEINPGTTTLEPVRGMKVFALVLGIPVTANTDGNGYYEINYRFSLGSIMGTEASNSRVKIRPFNISSGGPADVANLTLNSIVGTKHVYGWTSSCSMSSGKNFDFSGHTQDRLWCHILNAYYFHDVYCQQEGILNAPQDMQCYAIWTTGNTINSASTPLLRKYNAGTAYVSAYFHNTWLGILSSQIINPVYTSFYAALPDMTISVGGGSEPLNYSASITQIVCHELGHASQFRKVGASWYARMSVAELGEHKVAATPGNVGNGYGDGSFIDDNLVSLGESWAEFIGMNFARRRYPQGYMQSTVTGAQTLISSVMEYDEYFYGGGASWIPSGMFYDLMDPYNASETWADNASGATILNMYNTFSPTITDWCGYTNSYAANYNSPFIWPVFNHYNLSCGTRYLSDPFSASIQKSDCSGGLSMGNFVQVTFPAGAFASTTSVAAANLLTTAYAQTYANQVGTCSPCNTCIGLDKKCINNACITATRVNVSTTKLANGKWTCVYYYSWPDGTKSINHTETNAVPCLVNDN